MEGKFVVLQFKDDVLIALEVGESVYLFGAVSPIDKKNLDLYGFAIVTYIDKKDLMNLIREKVNATH